MFLRRALRALAALALVGTVASCGLQEGLTQSSGAGGGTSTPAPAIDATTITGLNFSWASVSGHAVVLDFWAAWCGPCRAEQADVNRLYARYAGRGVVFLGVDMRDDSAAATAYYHDYEVAYPSVNDADERISAAYDVAAPPTVVVVDQHGSIVQRFLGTVAGVSDLLDHLL